MSSWHGNTTFRNFVGILTEVSASVLQECIPVACVLSGGVCLGGRCLPGGRGVSDKGVSAWGCLHRGCLYPWGCLPRWWVSGRGCLSRGVSAQEGVYTSPVDTCLTHAGENITFPQLRLRTVKLQIFFVIFKKEQLENVVFQTDLFQT